MLDLELAQAESNSVFVRITTSVWSDSRGLCHRRDVRYIKRRCVGHNWLEEDVNNTGAEEVLDRMTLPVEDGIYKVVMINEHRDWETGLIEDWDYALCKMQK